MRKLEYAENGQTEKTSIEYIEDQKYVVTAQGGYDGYIEQEFKSIEEALEYVATLWNRG